MKRLSAPILAGVLALVLLGGTDAQAAILWQYDWAPVSSAIVSDGGLNQIDLSNQPLVNASGNTDVIASSVAIHSPFQGSIDTWTAQNWSLKMTIKDLDSGLSGILTFSGDFTGSATPSSANIDNNFHLPTTQSIILGDNEYIVSMNAYTPPGPPGSNPGSIGASVEVRPHGGQEPPPDDVPEPASLVLAGLGLAGFGLGAWRKRRQ